MGKVKKQPTGKADQSQEISRLKSRSKQKGDQFTEINENALSELAQYPTTLHTRQQAILRLQRSEGNRRVTQVLRKITENNPAENSTRIKEPYHLPTELTDIEGHVQRAPITEKQKEKEVSLPPGPYGPRRKRNDKMDPFEFKQNIFGPKIFMNNLPSRYRVLWKPLKDLIHQYWVVNSGDQAGIKIVSASQKKAAWNLLKATSSAKDMAIIKDNVNQKGETVALTEAVFVVFSQHYPRALERARKGYRQSDFRLEHEYFAAKYGFVKKPYAYLSQKKSKG